MSCCKFLASTLLALLLAPAPSLAQDDSSQCSTIAPLLARNASATLEIPALRLVYLGSDNSDVRIENHTGVSWQLSSYIRPHANAAPDAADTETVLWLDTGESNTMRLGRDVRLCHNILPLQVARNLTWTKDALERSTSDNGDCRSLVSEACLKRLQIQYSNSAARERSEYTTCREMNTTVPWECEKSGMVEAVSRPNPDFNTSVAQHFGHPSYPLTADNSTSTLEDPLVCDGRNFSSSFGTFAALQDYDVGTNFPLMDIMAFFPTVRPGRIFRQDMQRVQISCLLPGAVTEGSRQKAGVQDVLGRYNITGGEQTGGAGAPTGALGAWSLLAWAIGVGLVVAV